VLDIEHLPSELGLSCLFARVGLRVARRRRTPMMPITPGLELSRQLAQRLNPLTVLKLAALPAFNLTSFGFGEELELQPGTV